MNKITVIIIAGAFVFIIAVNVLMRLYTGGVREEIAPVPRAVQALPREEAEEAAVKPEPTGREPDDPAKLGIVIVSRMDKPTGPDQWDALLKKIFEESGTLKSKEGQAVVRKMQQRPAQYKATMKRLDEEISKAQMAVYRSAMDPLMQRRLEALYQMKALSHVLEKNGIVNPSAPALPTFEQGAGSFHGDGPR